MADGRPFTSSLAASGKPVRPTGREFWIDASNWSKELTDEGCAGLKSAGVVGVIIQAITGNDGISYTRQQLDACRRNGLRIAGYCWCFPGDTRASIQSRLAMFDGYTLESLWLDVEQVGLHIADVTRDLAIMDLYFGRPVGVYTARWFWQQQGWLGWTAWSDRPLWTANYDSNPDTTVDFVPFGGWTSTVIKQFVGTSAIGTVSQIDLDMTEG